MSRTARERDGCPGGHGHHGRGHRRLAGEVLRWAWAWRVGRGVPGAAHELAAGVIVRDRPGGTGPPGTGRHQRIAGRNWLGLLTSPVLPAPERVLYAPEAQAFRSWRSDSRASRSVVPDHLAGRTVYGQHVPLTGLNEQLAVNRDRRALLRLAGGAPPSASWRRWPRSTRRPAGAASRPRHRRRPAPPGCRWLGPARLPRQLSWPGFCFHTGHCRTQMALWQMSRSVIVGCSPHIERGTAHDHDNCRA
jgi:hypothetical protein